MSGACGASLALSCYNIVFRHFEFGGLRVCWQML